MKPTILKTIICIAALSFTVLLTPAVMAEETVKPLLDANVWAIPSSQGNNITVAVDINSGNESLLAAHVELNYDPNVLIETGFTPGTLLGTAILTEPGTPNITSGKVTYGVVRIHGNPQVQVNGTFFTVTFHVKNNIETASNVKFNVSNVILSKLETVEVNRPPCLILGAGLAAAEGRLTVALQPNLDRNISVASIAKAELFPVSSPDTAYKFANISGGEAKFNLSPGDTGYFLIRINNLSSYILTCIDDPTKNINQSVGQELEISVIGNLSDPDYLTKCYKTQGTYSMHWFNGGLVPISTDYACVLFSSKNSSLKFYVVTTRYVWIIDTPIDYTQTPIKPAHPNISKASFPKWVFNHGYDYGGEDSRCNTCHGNLDSKPESIDSVTINSGFCFGCHYGKEGIKEGVLSTISINMQPAPIPPKTPATPRAVPGFEVAVTVAALLILKLLIRRKGG